MLVERTARVAPNGRPAQATPSPEGPDSMSPDAEAVQLRAALVAAGSPQRRSGAQAHLLAAALLDLVGREQLGVAWEYAERNHESLLAADPSVAYSRLRDAAMHGDRSRMASRTYARTAEALDAVVGDTFLTGTAESTSARSIEPALIQSWLARLVGRTVTEYAADRLGATIEIYADSGSGMVAHGSCNPMERHRTRASSTQRLNNNPAIRSIFGDDNYARLAACRLLVGTDKTPGLLAFLGARLRGDQSLTPPHSVRCEWAKLLLDLDPTTRADGTCTTGSARWRARESAAAGVPLTVDETTLSIAV
jgi:hypothetical protein